MKATAMSAPEWSPVDRREHEVTYAIARLINGLSFIITGDTDTVALIRNQTNVARLHGVSKQRKQSRGARTHEYTLHNIRRRSRNEKSEKLDDLRLHGSCFVL
jgi:hypothetical protein